MRQARRVGIFAVVVSALLWIATIAIALVMIRRGGETGPLGVVEGLVRAAAVTVTIAGAIVYRAALRARAWFEHGYLAGQRDMRPKRTTSIASRASGEKVPRQDRQDSNRL